MAIGPRREKNGRRPVRSADDADGAGFLGSEAQQPGSDEGQKHTDLRSRSQQNQPRVGEHRGKIGHRADAQEDQWRIDAPADSKVQIAEHTSGLIFNLAVCNDPFMHVVDTQGHSLSHRNVANDGSHADRYQQQWFVVFLNRQNHEHDPDQDHEYVSRR